MHRIGRTGRAGKKGIALSLVSENESHRLEAIGLFQKKKIKTIALSDARASGRHRLVPPMKCLSIRGGRKNKIRAGDILGALTGMNGILGEHVGKIDVFDHISYVAIEKTSATIALQCLQDTQIKGKNFRVHLLRV